MAPAGQRQRRLTAVSSTMLLTLFFRTWDATKAEPILGDAWAARVLGELETRGYRKPLAKRAGPNRYPPLLRSRRLDIWTREYLEQHPDTVVLHLGCGLDSRAFRLDIPDNTEWYDVDMPDVIELRRELYPERPNVETVGSSVTEPGWIERYVPAGRRTLVIAEGLLMYLHERQIVDLVRALVEHCGDGELWFDSLPATLVDLPIGRLFPVNRLFRWGLSSPHEPEQWDPRIRLVEQAPVTTDHALMHDAGARFAFRHLSRTSAGRGLLQLTKVQWRKT